MGTPDAAKDNTCTAQMFSKAEVLRMCEGLETLRASLERVSNNSSALAFASAHIGVRAGDFPSTTQSISSRPDLLKESTQDTIPLDEECEKLPMAGAVHVMPPNPGIGCSPWCSQSAPCLPRPNPRTAPNLVDAMPALHDGI